MARVHRPGFSTRVITAAKKAIMPIARPGKEYQCCITYPPRSRAGCGHLVTLRIERSDRIEPTRQIEVVAEIIDGRRVFRVVDEQGNVYFVRGAMRPKPRKTFLLVIEFAKHCVFVAQHHEVPDP